MVTLFIHPNEIDLVEAALSTEVAATTRALPQPLVSDTLRILLALGDKAKKLKRRFLFVSSLKKSRKLHKCVGRYTKH